MRGLAGRLGRMGIGDTPTLAPGSVPLNPYLTGDTLNQALIAAGYDPTTAAELEAADAAIPGYGTGAGQYAVITNPANDSSLPGYNSNAGGQLYNVQSTIAPAPNQNVLANSAPQPTIITPARTVSALNPPSAIPTVTPASVASTQNLTGNPVLATSGGGSVAAPDSASWFTDQTQEIISGVENWVLLAGGVALMFFMSGGRR